MRLVLLGPPGGGKGTQAVRLAAAFNVPHVATGDLFRAEIAQGTDLGKLARGYIARGNLVPDGIVNGMVRTRLSKGDCDNYVLDGFPRTVEQAEMLTALLEEFDRAIRVAVKIEVPDEAIVERAIGRQVCSQCGAIYHLKAKPPRTMGICDVCRGLLEVREDDQPSTVRHRLAVYHRITEPVLDFYSQRGLLQKVDGVASPDDVFKKIFEICQNSCAKS